MAHMEPITQAVILAAGKGTRMLPLTLTRPKPLQEVLGKNLLEWKLAALPASITEVIFIVGYQGEQIRAFFGDVWGGRTIQYAEQKELDGSAGALLCARGLIRGRFLVMMGDDLYTKKDIERVLAHPLSVLVQEVENKEMGGEMVAHPDGTFATIIEEKHFVERGLVNTGLYVLDLRYFKHPPVPIGGSSTEFGLPHTLAILAKEVPVNMERASAWMQVSTPEDLKTAEEFVAKHRL